MHKTGLYFLGRVHANSIAVVRLRPPVAYAVLTTEVLGTRVAKLLAV